MKVDRDQLIEDGYIILREVVPPDSLENLRVSAEKMVQRQKAIWARERGPADPPGGVWETAPQPRLVINGFAGTDGVELVDEETAPVVEFWLHENVLGVSTELLCDPDAGVTEMMMMCNPVRDHGPADWHRDVSATFHGPLQSFVDDALENGPRYVQWNIPLYDDGVLWVVPGSHRRINTPEENRRLDADPRVPLPGSVCTGLKAGDGVVYMQPILHWASNYSTRLRRTIHGGFCMWSGYRDLSFTEHLTPSAKSTFDGWLRRSGRMQDLTESALRAATAGDVTAYRRALEGLQPGIGPAGRNLLTVYLSKVAKNIRELKRPDLDDLPADKRSAVGAGLTITLNWGAQFADRFSWPEAQAIWRRFESIDTGLQADEAQPAPGLQQEPTQYYANELPAEVSFERFVAGWV